MSAHFDRTTREAEAEGRAAGGRERHNQTEADKIRTITTVREREMSKTGRGGRKICEYISTHTLRQEVIFVTIRRPSACVCVFVRSTSSSSIFIIMFAVLACRGHISLIVGSAIHPLWSTHTHTCRSSSILLEYSLRLGLQITIVCVRESFLSI